MKQASEQIDRFVEFLIRETCCGCKECEPRLSTKFNPEIVCVEEGHVKWLLEMAIKFKEESKDKK